MQLGFVAGAAGARHLQVEAVGKALCPPPGEALRLLDVTGEQRPAHRPVTAA